MDDEDGRCLLDVICDPEALNDFLHGSETHLDTDDLLDGSSDPSSSFFSATGGHVSEVQPTVQLSANEPAGLPRVSVDLDFLEDDDILGGSPGGESGSNGIGTTHEPCDILQQSLAEANITEQSLQEAEAELDLGSFGIPGLAQVVQTLPDASLTGTGGTVGVGIGVGGAGTLFTGAGPNSTATPSNAAADMLGSVLAQQGLQLQSQVMNKTISVQPFMQPVGLGNVTLQPISSLHTLPNGSQSGLGIGQIQVVGQPTVMTINQSGQPILAKAMGGYQLHQSGPEISGAGSQASLGSSGSGLLIQGNKATLGSPALNGPAVCVSSTNSSSSGSTVTASAGIVGFGNTPLASGITSQTQSQGQIMQNVIIQRTPTPIQPKPPQGGAMHPKLYKQQPPQPTPQPQSDAHKGLGLQQIPVSAAQNVAFLAGKPGSNVVLSTQAPSQASQFQQTLFKQQAAQSSGKPLSVHLLNQSGSIVFPSQTVLQGQNPQFVQLQPGGQILTQHPGGHIITSQGPGGQLIANQILTTNQNINLGPVLTSQGPSGAAHILSGPIQLQPGQMGTHLFQMPVSLAQTHNQTQTHTVTGHAQTVIQGMPIQNPLMLGQVEGLSPAVSLQPNVQPQTGGVPSSGNSSSIAAGTTAQGQPECVTVLGSSTEQTSHPTQLHVQQPSVVAMGPTPSASSTTPIPSSSPSIAVSTSSTMTTMGLVPHQTQQNPGRLVFTNQGSSMILSQESLQMFLQQVPSTGHQQPLKIQNMCPSPALPAQPTTQRVSESPQPCPSPLTLSQHIQSPHQQQSRPPSQPQPQNQTPSRSCTPVHPPLFIIHNQSAESPQPTSQPHTAIQVQLQSQPTTHPVLHQQEMPSLSQSPKPASAQHQFNTSPINTAPSAIVKAQVPVMGLSTEQQHHLQLVTSQIQTLSTIAQPSPQQKQLLEKLHQVHHNIVLQSKQPSQPKVQPQATTHFGSQQDVPLDKVISSSSAGLPAQISSVLQSTSVVVKTAATGASDLQVFSGAQGPAATIMNQTVTPTCLNQPAQVQPKPGVISSVGGLTLGKGGVQLQVLGTSLTQMPAPQLPAAVLTHTTMKMPFTAEPSKEARFLEQLRKQQGSALHPNYSAPFNTFEDTLHRLLPYHLYHGNVHSSEDYEKVDEEFESVSSMLQKRTQAMVDKYRHLLFSESKQRLGPSAEMVMIDRMFIQEEKVAISQDRILAKERPEEFLANVRKWESAVFPSEKTLPSPEATSGSKEATASLGLNLASAPTLNVTPKPPTPTAPSPIPVPPSALHPPVSAPAPVPPISVPTPAHIPTTAHVEIPPVASAPSASSFPPTKLVIKQGGGGASVSWSSSCPTPPIDSTKSTAEPTVTPSSLSRASALSSSHFSASSLFNSKASDDDDTLLQRTSKPPIKTYEARRRIGLKLKIKQDQAGFSKVVHNTALDPVHTPQVQLSSQPTQPTSNKMNSAVLDPKCPPSSTSVTVIRTQTPVYTSSSSANFPSVSTAQSNPELRSNPLHKQASSTLSNPSVQMNGTMEHHRAGGVKPNLAASSTSSQTTCRLPLRKTYRENVSPRVRPGIPGGGDEGYSRTTDSPSSHKSSSPSERTVIASVKVEKRDNKEHVYRESSNNVGRSESAIHGLDQVDEVFSRGLKTSQYNVPQLSDRDCSKERKGEHTDFETGESKYKKMKNRQRAGGTFRMDQHAPGPPSPESFTRDSLLPAKRCKSDSPDMDNASFSSGSPPDDSLNEHLQCAIDSILNLQQEPTGHGPHIKSRPHHDHHLQGVSNSLSHRPSVLPSASSSSLAQHPQVRGRGHNGSLVPQTQSR